MTLGEKLSKLRKENNYTQEQLAEILSGERNIQILHTVKAGQQYSKYNQACFVYFADSDFKNILCQ